MVELSILVVYSLFHVFLVFLITCWCRCCRWPSMWMWCGDDEENPHAIVINKNDEMILKVSMVDDGDQQNTVVDHANQAKQIDDDARRCCVDYGQRHWQIDTTEEDEENGSDGAPGFQSLHVFKLCVQINTTLASAIAPTETCWNSSNLCYLSWISSQCSSLTHM